MEVVRRLREYIKAKQIQLAILADKMGVQESFLSNILEERQDMDTIDYYCICKALNVPLKTFVEE